MAFSAAVLQRQVRQALQSLHGVSETVRYKSFLSVTSDRSSTTVDMARTDTTKRLTPVVFTDYDERRIDGENILRRDRLVLVPVLSCGALTPKADDTITRENGEVWVVQDVSRDPANALFQLQVRR